MAFGWKSATRLAGLFSRARKAPELSSSVVKHDKMDDGVLDDMIERASLFRRTRLNAPIPDLDNLTDAEGNPVTLTDEQREQAAGYVAWDDLFDDVFRSLHTYDEPSMLPSDEIKPSRELNRRIMQQITSNENFQKLRPDTRHSPIEAAFTSISMADRLAETLTNELQEFVQRAQEMQDAEQQMEQNGTPAAGDKDAEADAEGLAQTLGELTQDQQGDSLGQNVMQAINDALDEGKEAADAMGSLPGLGEGSEARKSPDEMIELAKKWRESPMLQNIARMTGRLQRDIRQKRARRIVGGNEEIVDVTVGDDLGLILPHELAMLNHPLLKREFQRKYHEKSLLQYETEGTDSAGRGPVCIVIDGSGSMDGMSNEWARAVALALITVARRENRDAMAVEFSAYGQVKGWEFLKRETLEPAHVLDFVTHFFGGGTVITDGMQVAADFINTRPEFRKADIVLITDGHCSYGDEDETIRQALAAKGVRIHGVSIGMNADDNAYLQQMCDDTVSAYDMAGTNEASNHLAEVIV